MRALLLILLLTLWSPLFAMAGTVPDAAAGRVANAQPHHAPTAAQHATNAGHDSRCAGHTSTCLELDCGTCHAHGAAMVPSALTPQWPALGTAPASAAEQGHAPPWHARPYRPQWAALPARS
ncbi:DUF2946 family protein [Hydrogenophaga sp.]|uniref:DUF2946 family protein n=1 Tax=Hydrogenophaga sp. TaxID=1904254 RepID=UPI0027188144|nr:DUF2946 family protein [Hydrogenophaga sp.]MDO9436950.1 DUF2946 family protein [Hydrogenophaga sp.]